jgi:hypothetical protein
MRRTFVDNARRGAGVEEHVDGGADVVECVAVGAVKHRRKAAALRAHAVDVDCGIVEVNFSRDGHHRELERAAAQHSCAFAR